MSSSDDTFSLYMLVTAVTVRGFLFFFLKKKAVVITPDLLNKLWGEFSSLVLFIINGAT